MLAAALVLLALTPPAAAEPAARPVADAELRRSLAEASWADAEAAMRRAIAEELAAAGAPSPADAPAPTVEALVAHASSEVWQLRRHEFVFARALAEADAPTAAAERDWLRRVDAAQRIGAWARWLAGRVGWAGETVGLTAAAAGAGLGVGWLGGRWASVLGRRRRAGDPYAAPAPAIHGRDDLVDLIVSHLAGPDARPIRLVGERRIGRSTVLAAVGRRLRELESPWVTVEVALGDAPPSLAAERLAHAVRGAARDAGLDVSARAPAEIAADTLGEYLPAALIIDDLWVLVDPAAERARALLWEMALRPGAPLRLVAADDPGGVPDLDYAFDTREVPPLDDISARRVLIEPSRDRLIWTRAAIDAVLARAQGRPMRLRLWGRHLWRRCAGGWRPWVTASDVAAVAADVERDGATLLSRRGPFAARRDALVDALARALDDNTRLDARRRRRLERLGIDEVGP